MQASCRRIKQPTMQGTGFMHEDEAAHKAGTSPRVTYLSMSIPTPTPNTGYIVYRGKQRLFDKQFRPGGRAFDKVTQLFTIFNLKTLSVAPGHWDIMTWGFDT